MSFRPTRGLTRTLLAATLVMPLAMTHDSSAQDRRQGQRGAERQMERGQDGRRGGMNRGFTQPGRGGQDARGGRNGGWGGWGGGMFNSMARPGWERRDLRVLDAELDLDRDQEMIIETLLADYLEGFDAAAEASREAMREARPDVQVDDETRARFQAVREEIGDLRRQMREASQAGEAGDEDAIARREELSTRMRERIDEIREQARAFRPTEEQRNESSLAMAAYLEDWIRQRSQLDAIFREQLMTILTDRQIEQFPTVERTVRRTRFVPNARLSGEGVDVSNIARVARVDDQIDPVLGDLWTEYHITLDRLLVDRERHVETMGVVFIDAFRTSEFDPAVDASKTEARLRAAVRDLNVQTAREALFLMGEAGVSEEAIVTWRDEWRTTAFRQAWAPTTTHRSFAIAGAFEDLAPETAVAIEELSNAFQNEVLSLNQRIEAETIATDVARLTGRIERMADRMNAMAAGDRNAWGRGDREREPRAEDAVRDLVESRREIEQRYRDALESMLTPKQIEELPSTRRGRQGGWDEIRARFDRDGDGELNEEERRVARESMRGGRNRGGDGERGGRGGRGQRGGGNG